MHNNDMEQVEKSLTSDSQQIKLRYEALQSEMETLKKLSYHLEKRTQEQEDLILLLKVNQNCITHSDTEVASSGDSCKVSTEQEELYTSVKAKSMKITSTTDTAAKTSTHEGKVEYKEIIELCPASIEEFKYLISNYCIPLDFKDPEYILAHFLDYFMWCFRAACKKLTIKSNPKKPKTTFSPQLLQELDDLENLNWLRKQLDDPTLTERYKKKKNDLNHNNKFFNYFRMSIASFDILHN
nr:unnamed protein product [Callosobruchus analis]